MSVSNTASALLTAVTMLATEAKAGVNPAADLDGLTITVDKLLKRYDAEVAAALQVTIPGSKSDFASIYATLTQIVDGAVFTVSSTVDGSSTPFATAKGSAPAAGDTFQRSGTAPVFVGNATKRALVVAALTA